MGREKGSYYIIEEKKPKDKDVKKLTDYIKEWTFDKVVIKHERDGKPMDELNEYFVSYEPTIVSPIPFSMPEFNIRHNNLLIDKLMHLTSDKISPYFVTPQSLYTYEMYIGKNCLLKTTKFDALPFERSVTLEVNPNGKLTKNKNKLFLFVKCDFPEHYNEIAEEIRLTNIKTKDAKVTLKVDVHMFHEFKVEPIEENEEIKDNLSQTGSSPIEERAQTLSTKARIIFNQQNFSVTVFEESEELNLMDSDGLLETPLYVAFIKEKPIIGKAAMEAYNDRPTFVVFGTAFLTTKL